MKAFQLIEHGAPGKFELRDLPEPNPAPDEVLVRVRACGLNHLDLWTEQGGLPVPVQLPRTPGCEVAGEIEKAGSEVSGWQAGDRVAVQSNLFCGQCEFCIRGEDSRCLKSQLLGVQRDGGFAEKVVVPASALARLPENVSFETSAALTLAGSTAMHMLTTRTTVRQGDWVLVMAGASGVGSAAIQIAKQLGAYVISTGSTEEKRRLAREIGADDVIELKNDWPTEVRRITQKRGANLVVEHIGGDVLAKAFECLARGGKIVTCGATAGREISLNLWPLFVKEQSLIGSYGRNRHDFLTTLQWAGEKKLQPVIQKVFPLEDVASAFAQLRNRSVLGKLVVQP